MEVKLLLSKIRGDSWAEWPTELSLQLKVCLLSVQGLAYTGLGLPFFPQGILAMKIDSKLCEGW